MRLEPIENPKNWMIKVAYRMCKKRLGKVIMPLKVVYARFPSLARVEYQLNQLAEKGLTISDELRHLIELRGSSMNQCEFCFDLHKAIAIQENVSQVKMDHIDDYRDSDAFSDSEKAALAYIEEATAHMKVSDDTFEALRKHYSDREIVEITWVNAFQNYHNLMALPLGMKSDGFCLMRKQVAST